MASILEFPSADKQDALADLLSRVAEEDRAAFADLYRATCAKLYGIIARILGRGALAEEVMQDVYVRIWRRAGAFDVARGSPIAWLAAIARNRALDEVRRANPPNVELPDDLAAPSFDDGPLAARERSEALRALLRCLSGLETEKRDAILLAYYRGLSREALALRFDRPVSTIKTWLRRGLGQLRICLSQ